MRGEALSADQQQQLQALGRRLANSPVDIVCINTGRALADTVAIADALNDPCVRFVIAEHGAVIFDLRTQRTVEAWPEQDNPFDAIRRFLDWYRTTGLGQLHHHINPSIELLNKEANLTLTIPQGVEYEPMVAFIREQIVSAFPADADNFVFHHSVADRFLDVMAQVNKGDGTRALLQWLRQTEHIEQTDTVAVGNGSNDLPLLAVVDRFVCPSNSEAVVLDYCLSHQGFAATKPYIEATFEWLDSL